MKILSLLLIILSFSNPVIAEDLRKRDHYYKAFNTHSISGDKIQVVEFFWYACSHCYSFEPYLKKWLKNKPDDVTFIRIPATFNRNVVLMHAKTFYALEIMKVKNNIHHLIFDAIHLHRIPLNTQQAMEHFLAKQNINIPSYQDAMDSLIVHSKLKEAKRLAKEYGVNSVPTLIIDGRYRVEEAFSWQGKLSTADYLIKQIRKERNNILEKEEI